MKRYITVISKSEIRSGTSGTGRDWTLWELIAHDSEGNQIAERLKSFDPPALGAPAEVELEPDDREQGCYLVKSARGGGGGSKLAERVDALEARVDWLVSQLGAARPEPDPNQPTLATPGEAGVGDDADDIPFRRPAWPDERMRPRFRARRQWDRP